MPRRTAVRIIKKKEESDSSKRRRTEASRIQQRAVFRIQRMWRLNYCPTKFCASSYLKLVTKEYVTEIRCYSYSYCFVWNGSLISFCIQFPGLGCIPQGKTNHCRRPALLQAALHDLCFPTRHSYAGAPTPKRQCTRRIVCLHDRPMALRGLRVGRRSGESTDRFCHRFRQQFPKPC
jgi:hypothetical protein